MATTMDQPSWVERVLAEIPGPVPEDFRDVINSVATDALLALGEMVAESPVRHLLTADFAFACVGGNCPLNAGLPAAGGTLASNNILAILIDTIRWGSATHPDSQEYLQPIRGGTQHLAHAMPWAQYAGRAYIMYTISANALVLRWDDGSVPSDGNVIAKASYAPTFSLFSVVSADYPKLQADLVSLGVKLVAPQLAAQAQPAG